MPVTQLKQLSDGDNFKWLHSVHNREMIKVSEDERGIYYTILPGSRIFFTPTKLAWVKLIIR